MSMVRYRGRDWGTVMFRDRPIYQFSDIFPDIYAFLPLSDIGFEKKKNIYIFFYLSHTQLASH